MTISEELRAGAAYMRKYGYSHHLGHDGLARCFLGAMGGSICSYAAEDFLRDAIFGGDDDWCVAKFLRRDGWNKRDAIAALEIVAAIAEAEEGKL